MGQNQEISINHKIAIVGLGVNFTKNIDGIFCIFKDKKLIFVDKNPNAGSPFVKSINHENFIGLKDFQEYKIVLTSYNIDDFIKIYKKYSNNIFILKYNNNYNCVTNILKFDEVKLFHQDEPEYKTDRNVFITGTTSGIGLELSNYLLEREYTVYGLSRSNKSIIHPKYHHIKLDLCDVDKYNCIWHLLPKNLNSIYLNAGVSIYEEDYLNSDESIIINIFKINTIANILLLKGLVLHEKVGKETSIVYSKTNLQNSINQAIYSSSKIAFENYIEEFAMSQKSIYKNVYKIDPGWLKTKMGGSDAPNSVGAIVPAFLLPLLSNVQTKMISINAVDFSKNSISECFKRLKLLEVL